MSPQPLKKPNKPIPKSQPSQPSHHNNHNGGKNNGGNGNKNNNGGNNRPPSPWLNSDNEPQPNSTASFVEYLRWMREPEREYKDVTKIQILQIAQENANYRDRLKQLNQRTELIAGKDNTFTVKCPWRIRVGGHRGPESILLPAFDALGMPYIPASTLRGVARTQGIREIMAAKNIQWKDAEQQVAPYFGSIETANPQDCAGKVVFLDAYPLPSKAGGLSMDMANNIWKWDENKQPKYESNPNVFLSLEKSDFLIGLSLSSNCQDKEVLNKVKQWLISGLQVGVGSQINTGYGQLIIGNKTKSSSEFFRVKFAVEGQLIHGHQKFNNIQQPYKPDKNGNLKPSTSAVPEVRPTAFKSMLRYWFRAFSLGVLPAEQVINWESQIFGAITPKPELGWIRVNIIDGKLKQQEPKNKRDDCGEQEGILTLSYSAAVPQQQKEELAQFFKILSWITFRLGGIGLGARRPCYERNNNPYYRGSSLFGEDNFWSLPGNPQEFSLRLQAKIQCFYQLLERLTNCSINSSVFRTVLEPSSYTWAEAVDKYCQIIVVSQKTMSKKPFALDILHQQFHQLNNLSEQKNLCGGAKEDNYFVNNEKIKRKAIPSPIWIADYERYQVVTVFGATASPRSHYLQKLKQKSKQYYQIFPFS